MAGRIATTLITRAAAIVVRASRPQDAILLRRSSTSFRSPVHQLRPSGPPLASQRRAISVVEVDGGENCDHADHANGGLLAIGEKCLHRCRRGVPGSVIVRSVLLCRVVVPAQLRTRHSRWRGFSGRLPRPLPLPLPLPLETAAAAVAFTVTGKGSTRN